MKFVRYLLVAVLIFFASIQAQTTPADIFNFPELDFDTPEAAIEHFAKSIANNDLTGALQAFAINQYAEDFDFAALAKRVGAIDLYSSLAPAEYEMYRGLNRLNLAARYARQIAFFSYSFNSSEELANAVITNPSDEQVSTFVASVNPEELTNLKITKVIRINAESDRYRNILKLQAVPFGADEGIELLVLYELNDNYYSGGAHLLLYGAAWKIDSLSSNVGRVPALGNTTRMTLGDFESFMDELNGSENYKLEELNE
jgi:hypothetical protein